MVFCSEVKLFQGWWRPGEASLGLAPLKHGAELADIALSLQSEQFAEERLRETGRQRRKDRGHTAELEQSAPGHHFGVSLFVDIFLRMARSYPIPQELGGRSVASGAALKVRELRLCYE
jgi:hypothetical protein